jgi:hypothetical protein|tara:strand:- start:303 stop:410 length:108 start_codon:yes stop_codon:yes gene_type:complete
MMPSGAIGWDIHAEEFVQARKMVFVSISLQIDSSG